MVEFPSLVIAVAPKKIPGPYMPIGPSFTILWEFVRSLARTWILFKGRTLISTGTKFNYETEYKEVKKD